MLTASRPPFWKDTLTSSKSSCSGKSPPAIDGRPDRSTASTMPSIASSSTIDDAVMLHPS